MSNGRSLESIRMGIKDASARWLKASKGSEEGGPGFSGRSWRKWPRSTQDRHFYALDDPLEAAVFSVLVEMMKELAEADDEPAKN